MVSLLKSIKKGGKAIKSGFDFFDIEKRSPSLKGKVSKGVVPIGFTPGAASLAGKAIKPLALVGKTVVKSPIRAATTGLTTLTAGTVLLKSPKARKAVKKAPQTAIKGGEIIAETIEKGKPPISPKKALLTGGIAAGAVTAGVGLVTGAKKIKEKLATQIPTPSTQNQISLVPSQVPPQVEPIGVAKQPKAPAKEALAPSMPTINNNIKVKPNINVTVRNTKKRFINQQILITP